MDKLTEIMAHKRREIAPLLRPVSTAELARANADRAPVPSFAAALRRADRRLAVIAEIKRRSPSEHGKPRPFSPPSLEECLTLGRALLVLGVMSP